MQRKKGKIPNQKTQERKKKIAAKPVFIHIVSFIIYKSQSVTFLYFSSNSQRKKRNRKRERTVICQFKEGRQVKKNVILLN